MASLETQKPWLMLAILSGACAAFNGVFAKLTTTSVTASWAHIISSILHLPTSNRTTEYVIRILFFALNMTFNGVMWALFTRALALSSSAVRVNVINTASNFLITAVMGYLVFQEHLPPLWFVGAGMLVTGSVIIGARDEATRSGGSDKPSRGGENGGKIRAEDGRVIESTGSTAGAEDAGRRRKVHDSTGRD